MNNCCKKQNEKLGASGPYSKSPSFSVSINAACRSGQTGPAKPSIHDMKYTLDKLVKFKQGKGITVTDEILTISRQIDMLIVDYYKK
ncbi:MAG: aspartyl-phosphate phosphatase Spo0E family protein [Firmicutes bacterium]|nr:aspartyl-phosphate phosphatase Spo0E family protein [Bacillota bacterium]